MNVIKYLYRSITSPLEVMNQEEPEGKLAASFLIVIASAVVGSVIAPIAYYLILKNKHDLSLHLHTIFITFGVSILTWLAACAVFWGLAFAFRKELGFKQILSTWGFSYTPNLICIIVYNAIILKPFILFDNSITVFLISTFFIMLLVWKALYYFIEMKYVIKTTASELLVITVINGLFFAVFMAAGAAIGIEVPML
jgi:hypothetical protein